MAVTPFGGFNTGQGGGGYGGNIALGSSGNYYAFNPKTGKQERVYAEYGVAGPEDSIAPVSYYFESDGVGTPLTADKSAGQQAWMETPIKMGLQGIAHAAGGPLASGVVGGILWDDDGGFDWKKALTSAALSYAGGQLGGGGEVANSGMDFGGAGVGYDAAGNAAGAGASSTGNYFDSPNPYVADAAGVTDAPVYDAGSGLPSDYVGDIPVSGEGGSVYADLAPTTGGGGTLESIYKGLMDSMKGSGPNGEWTAADLLKLQTVGKVVAGGLGLLGSRQKERRQENQAREYDSRTRPYRTQLAELERDPTAYLTSPAVVGPVQQGTDALARALSVRFGNPAGSGTALQELQNYATTRLAGNLQDEKRRLAALSGIPQAAAAYPGASQAAIDSERGIYDVAGSTIYDITNPKPTLKQLLEEIYKMNSGTKTANSGYTGVVV